MAIDPNMAPEVPDPDAPAAPAEQQPNQWETWQQAGIDPSYDPHKARQALQFYEALSNRDQRAFAMDQLVQNDLPEGMTYADMVELARSQQQTDHWAAVNQPAQPDYYDPQTGQPVYQGGYEPPQQGMDHQALQQAIQAEIQRNFTERDQAEQQRRAQEAIEAEFTREMERVTREHELEPYEVQAIAGAAAQGRQTDPYASTKDLFERAYGQHQALLERRLQALSMKQQEAPKTGLPPGGTPSSTQVPQTADEAFRQHVESGG